MNARLFDEGVVEMQVWFDDLIKDFMRQWQGNRAQSEELEEVDDGDNQTPEDLYSQEE
jgi:hypothetical protein